MSSLVTICAHMVRRDAHRPRGEAALFPAIHAQHLPVDVVRHGRGIANAIGYDITPQSSGGGSDGNFTGAMGVTTLDGLGVQGAMAHTLEEHVLVDSLVPRARLMAGFLAWLST